MDIHRPKMNLKLYSHCSERLKMDTVFNIKMKTIKLIEENKGEKLCNDQATVVLLWYILKIVLDIIKIKYFWVGLPQWSRVVKNLPASAGDMDLISGPGTKIPRVTGHLSLCTRTAEPMHPRAHAPNKKSHHNEKPLHCKKSSPHSPQLEKACMQQQSPSTTKNKF